LERYRLAEGRFPESLDDLVPKFAAKLPVDIVDGKPLHYRCTADGYTLYSEGWNQTDDGGTVVLSKGSQPSVDSKLGDWVWQMISR